MDRDPPATLAEGDGEVLPASHMGAASKVETAEDGNVEEKASASAGADHAAFEEDADTNADAAEVSGEAASAAAASAAEAANAD
eukprot:8985231-Prorocentrum_lima.AAC.1